MNKIVVQNIVKAFNTGVENFEALKDVSFEINEGQCTVIGGENGSGKSVLMSIISGLEDPDSGSVSTYGRVGLVFQEAETQILGETIQEDISYGPKNMGWKQDKIDEQVTKAMKMVGLYEKREYPARFLSGGEKRRLAVACMLSMELPIIIFDEPYANLDYMGVKQVNNLIKNLKKEGKTVIILTHEIEKCLGLAERFIVLFRGNKVFDGTPLQGLKEDLEQWNIRNPFNSYKELGDLVW